MFFIFLFLGIKKSERKYNFPSPRDGAKEKKYVTL